MKALKTREMLRHGVRVCMVWPQPRPSACGSAPSVSRSDAVPRHFYPGGTGTVARLKRVLLPPTVAVATSERLLRPSPPQEANAVPSPPPPRDLKMFCGFTKGRGTAQPRPRPPPGTRGSSGSSPGPQNPGGTPHPQMLPVPGSWRVVTAMQHTALLSSRFPVVLRCWLHLGLPCLETKVSPRAASVPHSGLAGFCWWLRPEL